jgi:hypothetical protein
MKALTWIGVLLLVLGIASFFITVPQKERQGVKLGGASVGVETTTSQHLPAWASAVLLVGGILVIALGSRSKAA